MQAYGLKGQVPPFPVKVHFNGLYDIKQLPHVLFTCSLGSTSMYCTHNQTEQWDLYLSIDFQQRDGDCLNASFRRHHSKPQIYFIVIKKYCALYHKNLGGLKQNHYSQHIHNEVQW